MGINARDLAFIAQAERFQAVNPQFNPLNPSQTLTTTGRPKPEKIAALKLSHQFKAGPMCNYYICNRDQH
jgi:hypothetical protein